MKASDLREKYLKFFESKGHKRIKSASLIPENDPTVLFTTAGMHPLVPYLLGEHHPQGKRLTNVQKCIRTGDIDEVGDICHLTFFEMLGNWSLGDYFKRDAIEYSFEFLTGPENLNIPLENLAFSVFAGDADAPFDSEAFAIWRGLGVKESRIARLGKKHNWWGPAGQTGPCGPDTEMFYWVGLMPAPDVFDPEDKNWVEIWNDVFMQYNKTAEGKFEPLQQTNVDTGMGLERVTLVLQGKKSIYETELFMPLFAKLDEIRKADGETNRERTTGERIIVEHMRAATFIMADGVVPGNVDHGYILRRLIRRAIREARKLGLTEHFTSQIAEIVIDNYSYFYVELSKNADKIKKAFSDEETQFAHTLEKGTKEFEKTIDKIPAHIQKKILSGKTAFFLYETYGFPIELTEEMAKERGFEVDKDGFQKAYQKHQELSRQGAENKFKGGLADNSEMTTALHTATHLMHAALRKVLGEHVEQKGSNITVERLRFDFCHNDKMTPEQIAEVEKLVNDAILSNLEVSIVETSVDEAKKMGAIGLFEDRYAEKVKVYSIGNFSKEICGGPHVANTSSMGRFKIQKEESSSRGIRRIKAVLEK
ncbi:MAG TPA: alanine--tRNA ligase [Lentisphaeria bacterium]|nr:MAG: alanine--tRNA ligase [Lentisphaerae bacterium GWF2_38_69]HBM17552.1 alanine--tRNA ligase [Lentisphaeria bacterium]